MLLQHILGLVRAASCLQSLVKLFLLIIGGARSRPRPRRLLVTSVSFFTLYLATL